MNDPLLSCSATQAPERSVDVSASVLRVRDGRVLAAQPDSLAEETPVALEYNGISHATMLASPADLEDFAVGFSLTEGIIDSIADVRDPDSLARVRETKQAAKAAARAAKG